MDFIRTSAIGAALCLCLAAPAIAQRAPPPMAHGGLAEPHLGPPLDPGHWPTALSCRFTHGKPRPDGTESKTEMINYTEWSYLMLGPSGNGRFVYARGSLPGHSDDRAPVYLNQSPVVAIFESDGSPVSLASQYTSAGEVAGRQGNCMGRSIQSLIAGGQTR